MSLLTSLFLSFLFADSAFATGKCEAVFTLEEPVPTLQIDFTLMTQEQAFVSRQFQKAHSVSENNIYNETMGTIAVALNRMLDPYVEALLFLNKFKMDPNSQAMLLQFVKANENFFLSVVNGNKQVLSQILNLRASVLEAERAMVKESQPIGFLKSETHPGTSNSRKSIGFLETNEKPSQPMESIGFIQNGKIEERSPQEKLPSIGFVQTKSKESKTQSQVKYPDVSYRLNLVVHPDYGFFDLAKP